MRFKHALLGLILCLCFSSAYTQSPASAKESVEWVVVKQSAIDTTTLQYFQQKGWVQVTEPQNQNSNVFVSVTSIIAGLLDQSINSITQKTNEFYSNGFVGWAATWGVFYAYVGKEIMYYVWIFVYLCTICTLFFLFWKKYCIHTRRKIDLEALCVDELEQQKDGSQNQKSKDAARVYEEEDGVDVFEVQYASVSLQLIGGIVFMVLLLIGSCSI